MTGLAVVPILADPSGDLNGDYLSGRCDASRNSLWPSGRRVRLRRVVPCEREGHIYDYFALLDHWRH